MNKYLLSFAFLCIYALGFSQNYEFQSIKDIVTNPVISQDHTGTCWSFSTTSFLEAEIIRTTGKHIDLSEMFTVRNTYPKKAWVYVMRQGKAQFGEGGLAHDVINSARDYGIVPQSVYSGKITTDSPYDHTEMVAAMETLLKSYVANPQVELAPNWKNAISDVLDNYMGKTPTEFTYEGVQYTPASFFKSTKLNPKNYVTISSYTHEVFYKPFLLDIPDNFSNGLFYNLPLDEYIQNIDYAIDKGFSLALDCDVSEASFSGKIGVAAIPEDPADTKAILKEIKPEKTITPAIRQAQFESYATTDDHLMHIVGKVKDQTGKVYYKVKNSWGSDSGKDGYVYMSAAYLRLKSISVLLHKDGLSPKTKVALGL